MKTVWKFTIPLRDVVSIVMPRGAEIIHVANQFGTPTIWALVDPAESLVNREFRFAGTGHLIPEHHLGKHVGSFLMDGGSLVFHIFETQASQIDNGLKS